MKESTQRVWLLLSTMVVFFLLGTVTAGLHSFPYPYLRDAGRTIVAIIVAWRDNPTDAWLPIGPTAIAAQDAPRKRWTQLDEKVPGLPVTVVGGRYQYLDLCPDEGCLAVSFDAERRVTHAWPYRPREIFAQDLTQGRYPHEALFFDPRSNVYPIGLGRYANGDILVTFHIRGALFPYGMGMARIDANGHPRWTRNDYTHHWPTMSSNGTAYALSASIGTKDIAISVGPTKNSWNAVMDCQTDRPYHDIIQEIGESGEVLRTIELIPLLLQSRWAGVLASTMDQCDPLHTNFVDIVQGDDDSLGGSGLTAGDLVVSMRNLSRFAIIDRDTQRIKRLVGGNFVQQHSVHHVSGSKFVMFDNLGGDPKRVNSRIVEFDIESGKERRIFPSETTPKEYAESLSYTYGHLSLSPDRKRVFASYSLSGRAFEIDIATGQLIAVYDVIHDIASKPDVPQDWRAQAVRFNLFQLSYDHAR